MYRFIAFYSFILTCYALPALQTNATANATENATTANATITITSTNSVASVSQTPSTILPVFNIQSIKLDTRRKSHKSRSTSSSSGEKGKDDSSKGGESLGLTGTSSSSSSSDEGRPKSSKERKGWRKWHRKCTPCPDDMKMKWRDPGVQWICGGYQRARRSFKSRCMMRLRNCQDGTMFVFIHNHQCEDDDPKRTYQYRGERHGNHFFYDYKVIISGDSSNSDSSSSSSSVDSSGSSSLAMRESGSGFDFDTYYDHNSFNFNQTALKTRNCPCKKNSLKTCYCPCKIHSNTAIAGKKNISNLEGKENTKNIENLYHGEDKNNFHNPGLAITYNDSKSYYNTSVNIYIEETGIANHSAYIYEDNNSAAKTTGSAKNEVSLSQNIDYGEKILDWYYGDDKTLHKATTEKYIAPDNDKPKNSNNLLDKELKEFGIFIDQNADIGQNTEKQIKETDQNIQNKPKKQKELYVPKIPTNEAGPINDYEIQSATTDNSKISDTPIENTHYNGTNSEKIVEESNQGLFSDGKDKISNIDNNFESPDKKLENKEKIENTEEMFSINFAKLTTTIEGKGYIDDFKEFEAPIDEKNYDEFHYNETIAKIPENTDKIKDIENDFDENKEKLESLNERPDYVEVNTDKDKDKTTDTDTGNLLDNFFPEIETPNDGKDYVEVNTDKEKDKTIDTDKGNLLDKFFPEIETPNDGKDYAESKTDKEIDKTIEKDEKIDAVHDITDNEKNQNEVKYDVSIEKIESLTEGPDYIQANTDKEKDIKSEKDTGNSFDKIFPEIETLNEENDSVESKTDKETDHKSDKDEKKYTTQEITDNKNDKKYVESINDENIENIEPLTEEPDYVQEKFDNEKDTKNILDEIFPEIETPNDGKNYVESKTDNEIDKKNEKDEIIDTSYGIIENKKNKKDVENAYDENIESITEGPDYVQANTEKEKDKTIEKDTENILDEIFPEIETPNDGKNYVESKTDMEIDKKIENDEIIDTAHGITDDKKNKKDIENSYNENIEILESPTEVPDYVEANTDKEKENKNKEDTGKLFDIKITEVETPNEEINLETQISEINEQIKDIETDLNSKNKHEEVTEKLNTPEEATDIGLNNDNAALGKIVFPEDENTSPVKDTTNNFDIIGNNNDKKIDIADEQKKEGGFGRPKKPKNHKKKPSQKGTLWFMGPVEKW